MVAAATARRQSSRLVEAQVAGHHRGGVFQQRDHPGQVGQARAAQDDAADQPHEMGER